MNYLYKNNPVFFANDYIEEEFEWIIVDDSNTSVFAYERRLEGFRFLVVLNMANMYHKSYEFPYNEDLKFIEKINSFSPNYGGAREEYRQIEIKKGNTLKLELWEYEACIFEIVENNEKTN